MSSFAVRLAELENSDSQAVLLESYREVSRLAVQVKHPVKTTISKIAKYCFELNVDLVRQYISLYPRLTGLRDSEGNGLIMWTFWALTNTKVVYRYQSLPLRERGLLMQDDVLELVCFLLEHGADPRWTARDGYHFTHLLCSLGAVRALEFCEQRGICRWHAEAHWRALPLDYFLVCGHLELFLQYRSRGETSGHILQLVAYCGSSIDCLRFLLSIPDIRRRINHTFTDPVNGGYWTPLTCAIRAGRAAYVRLLLEAGARADLVLPCGTTPLELFLRYASKRERNLALLDDLLAAGADPNRPFCTGQQPIEWVVRHGGRRTLEKLLAIEGPLEIRLAPAREGSTPLPTLALQSKKLGMLELVLTELAARANLPAKSAPRSPLAAAIRLGFRDCVAALLQVGQQIPPRDLPHLFEMAVLAGSFSTFQMLHIAIPSADLARCDWTAPLAAALCANDHRFAVSIVSADPARISRSPELLDALTAGHSSAFYIAFKHADDISWEYVFAELKHAATVRRLRNLVRTEESK